MRKETKKEQQPGQANAGTPSVMTKKPTANPERHTTQYFEMAGNRGIYHHGWTAVARHTWARRDPRDKEPPFAEDRWEMYAPEDWSQARFAMATQ